VTIPLGNRLAIRGLKSHSQGFNFKKKRKKKSASKVW
jgi:hypothetical protein